MMPNEKEREWSRSIVCRALDGLELVQARFATHTFPLHAHADYVIGAVTQGAKRSRVGFRDMEIGPGMLTLFNPYEEHTSAGVTGSWTFTGFYPSPALIARCFGDLGAAATRTQLSRTVCHDPTGAIHIHSLYSVLRGSKEPLEIETRLVETLEYFFTRHGTFVSSGIKSIEPGIHRARERLDADLSGRAALAELGAVAGLPKVNLLRRFRRAFGCTPYVYSTARRIACAKRALADGDAITDIAARFGFCDQSHFTRVFHRWTGTSPAKFAAAVG